MADSHPTNQVNRDATSSKGGWTPSRGFWTGMGGAVAIAAVLVLAGALTGAGHAHPVAADSAATAASGTVESPKTVASSWSMSPLPEDGNSNVVTSGTSTDPVQQSSSVTVWMPGDQAAPSLALG